MEYRQLGGSGFKVPVLTLGTAARANSLPPGATTAEPERKTNHEIHLKKRSPGNFGIAAVTR
jgi:aryl-alcohol dehydrogenase-like predicted oxidoreductase